MNEIHRSNININAHTNS